MEDAIKKSYSQRVFDEIASKHCIDSEQVEELDGFESFIYQVRRQGTPPTGPQVPAARRHG